MKNKIENKRIGMAEEKYTKEKWFAFDGDSTI